MKLESSRIRGVLRFKDEVAIPYRDLPAGIIAFRGPNGEGKSTALESPLAGAYREFPSRSDWNILDVTTRSDAFIETVFELEGVGLFRTRLNLDGPHRTSEGIIARINPDGSETILNDGKVSTFDQAVTQILPPKDLMLLSVFSAQNKAGSFGELDRKARRERFGMLLGLEHYQTMSERAKSAAGLVEREIETLTVRRDVLAREAGDAVAAELDGLAQQLQVEIGAIEQRRDALQRDLDAIERELATWQDAAAAHAATQAKADRLAVDLMETARALDAARDERVKQAHEAPVVRANLVAATEATVTSLRAQAEDRSALTKDQRAIADRLAKTLADVDERIRNNQNMIEQREAIRSAVAAIEERDREVGRLRIEQGTQQERVEILTRRLEVLANALHDVERAELQLQTAERDAALLQVVPFGDKCVTAACPAITNAAAAGATIPGLKEQASARATIEQERAAVDSDRQKVQAEISRIALRVAEVEREKVGHKALAAKADKLAAAEARIAELRQAVTKAKADAERESADADARDAARRADLAQRAEQYERDGAERLRQFDVDVAAKLADLAEEVERLSATMDRLTVEREALDAALAQTQDASTNAAAQSALLALRRKEWDASTADRSRVQAQIEALNRRRETFVDRRREFDALSVTLETLHTDLIEWTLLSKALGRDGLQTLEIDEAGPTISKYANDLLDACYGSRFTLELITQEAKRTKGKDGSDMKEVFEVRVYDGRDGGEARDIGLLSGGERVIVEEVLRSAIALLVNRRNVRPIRTVWRDESTGALSAENAERYMRMLRRLRELGGFHQVIVVTHSEDCALQADVQVWFKDGRIEIVEPPYERAA